MKHINRDKEFVVRIPNERGTLAKVLTPLAEARINLRCIDLTPSANEGLVRFCADDEKRVLDILRENDFTFWQQEVVSVELSNEPGNVAQVATRLAQNNIDIRALYASTGTGANTTLYLWTNDNQKAVDTLKN